MNYLLYVPVVLSLLVLGAHFLRDGNLVVVALSLVPIGLLFVRQWWAARAVQVILVLAATEWGRTLYEMVQIRVAHGQPVTRMAMILGVVILVTLGSALLFQARPMRERYRLD